MTNGHKQRIVIEQVTLIGSDRPDVPLNPAIDLEALTQLDRAAGEDPVFATLPLAQIGQITRNRRRYDAAAVDALRAAIATGQITGGMGHPQQHERQHDYKAAALKWVGALLVGDVLWGKAYLTRSQAGLDLREEWRVALATGGSVATSIYALAHLEYDAQADVFDVREPEFQRIDAVNPHYAGAAIAAATPHLTSEMVDDPALLLATLRMLLNLTPADDLVGAVRDALHARDRLQTEFDGLLRAYLSAQIAQQVPVERLRPLVQSRVLMTDPQSQADVDAALQSVLTQPEVRVALDDGVQAEMGPALVPGWGGPVRLSGLADNPWTNG